MTDQPSSHPPGSATYGPPRSNGTRLRTPGPLPGQTIDPTAEKANLIHGMDTAGQIEATDAELLRAQYLVYRAQNDILAANAKNESDVPDWAEAAIINGTALGANVWSITLDNRLPILLPSSGVLTVDVRRVGKIVFACAASNAQIEVRYTTDATENPHWSLI